MIQYKYGKGDEDMTRKLTNEEFLSRLDNDVVPLEEYTSGEKKIKVTYKSCGHTEYKTAKKLLHFDGCQHFENSSRYWGGNDTYEAVRSRDNIKNKYCEDKEIPLLRIPYWWIRSDRAERELDMFLSKLESAVFVC
jgi:hypothetical protein